MIHVENLTRYYNDVCAVNRINLEINKGEILGLLGPNGAGKTTTLRMLTGFLHPTSGTIRVKDMSIDTDILAIKSIMGYLPESAPIYPEMLVYDYLGYVADIRGIPKGDKLSRIRKMADMCGLNAVMHQPVTELSKGYKQRVGLAHAMMNDPEILVLDEPTSGLDPNQIVEIRDIIRSIGKEKTIIFSTHILSEAEATCDRIAIIDKGKIVADQSTQALKQQESRETVINLVLAGVDSEKAGEALGKTDGVLEVWTPSTDSIAGTGEIHLKLRCAAASDLRQKIYHQVRQTGWDLLEFYSETPSLENIFRKLTTAAE
ncbi:MAG: ATP-binding cassette domain-containing protein [Thermodesulfobacteriota bacterium]|nr:ATP-binding cassette domain-containing protein [Thermodesulfobacteriota bacterium]